MGAGVIPFCVKDGTVRFLFHQTFSGRRAGYLVDFGGGGRPGEDYRQTAVREFVEETETMYFEPNLSQAVRSEERIHQQNQLVESLFEQTLASHPDWVCRREPGRKTPPKDWLTFFIEMKYRDPEPLNRQWDLDDGRRFSKRRRLQWLSGNDLLDLYQHNPERLWKRVRQLQGAPQTILSILNRKQ